MIMHHYQYEIVHDDSITIVVELINDIRKNGWELNQLRNKKKWQYDENMNNSFHRTKKWIIENYPEFMI